MMKYVLASFLAVLSFTVNARPDWNVVITSPNVSLQIAQPGYQHYQPQYQYRPYQPYQNQPQYNYSPGYYQPPSYHNPYNQGRPVIYPHHPHHHHHRR